MHHPGAGQRRHLGGRRRHRACCAAPAPTASSSAGAASAARGCSATWSTSSRAGPGPAPPARRGDGRPGRARPSCWPRRRGEHAGLRDLRKHTGWYLTGYPVGGDVRRASRRWSATLAELEAIVAALDPTITPPADAVRRAPRHPVRPPAGHAARRLARPPRRPRAPAGRRSTPGVGWLTAPPARPARRPRRWCWPRAHPAARSCSRGWACRFTVRVPDIDETPRARRGRRRLRRAPGPGQGRGRRRRAPRRGRPGRRHHRRRSTATILGKPADARRRPGSCCAALSGRTHQVHTGVAVAGAGAVRSAR